MMCAFCKGKEMVNIIDKYLISLDNTVLIVNNVPTMECVQCGEKFYMDEVSEVLEKIVNESKTISAEILVVDYNESNKIEVVR